MIDLKQTNNLIKIFEDVVKNPIITKNKTLYTGIDLGTAFIVLAVMDEEGKPVAGAYQYAEVVKDGMVVDYIGAVDIVKQLKQTLEEKLGTELLYGAAAIPPGTEFVDSGVVKNVCESAGFEIINVLDEPSAANMIINVSNGAVVDIGGGTTGISIIKDGKVVKVIDEPTGGTHFSLVLAGAYKISFEEAELIKRDYLRHEEIFPVLKAVVDKIVSIINKSIIGYDVSEIVIVGGTASLTGIEKYMSSMLKMPVLKPDNPMFVTPLGIARSCVDKGDK